MLTKTIVGPDLVRSQRGFYEWVCPSLHRSFLLSTTMVSTLIPQLFLAVRQELIIRNGVM